MTSLFYFYNSYWNTIFFLVFVKIGMVINIGHYTKMQHEALSYPKINTNVVGIEHKREQTYGSVTHCSKGKSWM